MSENYLTYVQKLNDSNIDVRLDSLRKLKELIDRGELKRPETGSDVNNHIHTFYSFSPYSPSKAVWMAYNSGLTTAGIMDHDSVSGAGEFIEAGKIIGLATTVGVECRVDFSQTSLNGRRLNNPDQNSIAYMAIHGIPHNKIDEVKAFFQPYTAHRNDRNRKMVERITEMLKPIGIAIDFDKDVVPLSKSREGGSITERHILYAVSLKIMDTFGKGEKVVDFLRDSLNITLPAKVEKLLMDADNPYYDYDLLGALKSELVAQFYIDAVKECPEVWRVISLVERIGAISAYAYLGDVKDSVTGDKKAQKFEDEYLEELFEILKRLKFNAITYMPSRNSMEQLKRLKSMCTQFGFFEISGEDINTPRQSFVCEALRKEEFKNLIDATWALIAHEKAATEDASKAFFSEETVARYPELEERIQVYKQMVTTV